MDELTSCTAVTEIRDLALAVSANIGTNLGVGAVALPDNFTIEDVERFMPLRRRFRGKLHTHSLSDFILYVKTRAGDATAPGFIDADKLSATVLFNLGTVEAPGHAEDAAILQPKASPAYAALLASNSNAYAHQDALNWLQDWSDHIAYADEDGADLPGNTSYNALRKVTISALNESTSEERTHGATRSALAQVEAKGNAPLPALIRFTCTPYKGLPERVLWVRLQIRDNGGKPVFLLRIRNLDREKEAIGQAFKRTLLEELDGRAGLTLGTFTP